MSHFTLKLQPVRLTNDILRKFVNEYPYPDGIRGANYRPRHVQMLMNHIASLEGDGEILADALLSVAKACNAACEAQAARLEPQRETGVTILADALMLFVTETLTLLKSRGAMASTGPAANNDTPQIVNLSGTETPALVESPSSEQVPAEISTEDKPINKKDLH